MGDVLAGESAGEEVDRLNRSPVDGGDVSEVRDAGPVPLEDFVAGLLSRLGVVLAVPCEAGSGCAFESEREASAA